MRSRSLRKAERICPGHRPRTKRRQLDIKESLGSGRRMWPQTARKFETWEKTKAGLKRYFGKEEKKPGKKTKHWRRRSTRFNFL